MPDQNPSPDFYFNEAGLMVMSESYLLKRGYCCGNGCTHCPYQYESVPEPRRSALLAWRNEEQNRKPNNKNQMKDE